MKPGIAASLLLAGAALTAAAEGSEPVIVLQETRTPAGNK
jgi:hypothetical protein